MDDKCLDRREFIMTAGVALGGGLLWLGSSNAAKAETDAVKTARKLKVILPPNPPKRLCDVTHSLAGRGLSGEWGREPAKLITKSYVEERENYELICETFLRTPTNFAEAVQSL